MPNIKIKYKYTRVDGEEKEFHENGTNFLSFSILHTGISNKKLKICWIYLISKVVIISDIRQLKRGEGCVCDFSTT